MTVDPAHLAAGAMEEILQKIEFDDGSEKYTPTVRGFLESIHKGTKGLEQGEMAHLEAML